MDVGLKLKNRKVWFNCMDYSFHSYIFFIPMAFVLGLLLCIVVHVICTGHIGLNV